MQKLTDNFSIWEFEDSYLATRYNIDNKASMEIISELRRVAGWLQILRDKLCTHYGRQVSISITSGYRCPKLNKKAKGSRTSAHMKGRAADIRAKDIPPKELFLFIKRHMTHWQVDQCIWEFDSWVHIGFRPVMSDHRGQFLKTERVKTFWGSEVKYTKYS